MWQWAPEEADLRSRALIVLLVTSLLCGIQEVQPGSAGLDLSPPCTTYEAGSCALYRQEGLSQQLLCHVGDGSIIPCAFETAAFENCPLPEEGDLQVRLANIQLCPNSDRYRNMNPSSCTSSSTLKKGHLAPHRFWLPRQSWNYIRHIFEGTEVLSSSLALLHAGSFLQDQQSTGGRIESCSNLTQGLPTCGQACCTADSSGAFKYDSRKHGRQHRRFIPHDGACHYHSYTWK